MPEKFVIIILIPNFAVLKENGRTAHILGMRIAHTRRELKEYLAGIAQTEIGFVPTMGALHAGHLSLVGRARRENGTVVVSVFVNPTQFNDAEDLRVYPRTPAQDLELLEKTGADIVFMPSVEEVYPEPDDRRFDFGELESVMEGASRPGHFNGVAQVVSRFFEMIAPAKAYFGEKDFQQVAIVCEMVRQLGMEVEIVASPIVREHDGLAMSSRNALLDDPHRNAAPMIYMGLSAGLGEMARMTPAQVEKFVTDTINSDKRLEVIYFNLVNRRTLKRVGSWEEGEEDGIQGCVAVRAGTVRLIDNIRFV